MKMMIPLRKILMERIRLKILREQISSETKTKKSIALFKAILFLTYEPVSLLIVFDDLINNRSNIGEQAKSNCFFY